MTRLWLEDDSRWTDAGYTHPVRTRLGCLEIVALFGLVLLGWVLVLWCDATLQGARSVQPRQQEVQR